MSEILTHLLIVMVPLVLTNVLHMLVVKSDFFSKLAIPIYEKAFGKNKTWRGLLFVSFTNAFVLSFVNLTFRLNIDHDFLLGGILGIVYILSELPNSLIKRKLGVQPGMKSENHRILFILMDKTDSAFGVTLIYFLLGYTDLKTAFLLFIINSLTHLVISLLLVVLKIKSSF